MKLYLKIPLALACFVGLSAFAGVTVTQNVSPGATSWPGSPILSTMANPSASATVGESFNGGGGNTNLSETFTITTTNYLLQTIDIYASGGSGTVNGTNLVLNLYDLGMQTAPNPSPYTGSGNLLGGGAGVAISYVAQGNAILKLDFTGSDQALLQKGHIYAFELSSGFNSQTIFWYRGTSDTYSGGAAYRNQTWINGSNARDFALAVYGTVTSSTLTTPTQSTVDWNDVYQRIDGFGASSAWNPSWSTTQGNMFFATNVSGTGTSLDGTTNFSFNSIGLSLLRTRIAPGGTTVESNIMVMAQARGAKVWSTPWSPAANFKSNGNVNGGSIVGTTNTYLAYASQLAAYVVSMKTLWGINLYALSVQNEPDANVTTYDSCNWTAQQIHDFLPYLSSALTASNMTSTKIMLPESQNWQDPASLAVTAMTDSATSNLVSIIADHNYDGATGPASLTKNSYGKALWETEVALLNGSDSSITNAVYYAGRIHLFMTVAQANAWHYWWLVAGGTAGNEGLADTNGVPTKRMYALGQFSRFVRPGFNRVGTTGTGDAQVSAYKDATTPGFAIVAVNPDSTAISQTFTLTNFNANTVTPWMTTSNLSLVQQSSVSINNQSFTYTLPALSIVTFVGSALITNTSPAFNAIATQTINAGVTFAITNVATDTDSPLQTLTYSLLTAPAGAALNTANGIFTWRPTVAQANSINLIAVVVTDNGLPPLSATNSFTIQVNPLAAPVMNAVTSVGSGGVGFSVSGPSGPDYTLLVSTNLTQWHALYTSNSPALPVMLLDTNPATAPQRFYRVQIGP